MHTTNIFLWLSAIRQGRGANNGKCLVYCTYGYKRCSEWSGSSTVRQMHTWDEAMEASKMVYTYSYTTT